MRRALLIAAVVGLVGLFAGTASAQRFVVHRPWAGRTVVVGPRVVVARPWVVAPPVWVGRRVIPAPVLVRPRVVVSYPAFRPVLVPAAVY